MKPNRIAVKSVAAMICLILVLLWAGIPRIWAEEPADQFSDTGDLVEQRRKEREQQLERMKKLQEEEAKKKLEPQIELKTWNVIFNGKFITFDDESPIDGLNNWPAVLAKVDEIVKSGENINIVYNSSGNPVSANNLWKLKHHLATARRNPVVGIENLPYAWAQEMVKAQDTTEP